jgi:hypothetical protein
MLYCGTLALGSSTITSWGAVALGGLYIFRILLYLII